MRISKINFVAYINMDIYKYIEYDARYHICEVHNRMYRKYISYYGNFGDNLLHININEAVSDNKSIERSIFISTHDIISK